MSDLKSGDNECLRRFVPSRPICTAAFEYARGQLPSSILHHSVRTFLFAKWLAEREKSVWCVDDSKVDRLFIACICHDVGATHNHDDGDLRFEVEGADATKKFALSQGIDEAEAHDIWVAVAIHTSQQIAERIRPLARLVRLGVLLDFRQVTRDELEANEFATSVERDIPRLEIEKVLGDAIVRQALHNRTRHQKHPGQMICSEHIWPTQNGKVSIVDFRPRVLGLCR